MHITSAPCPTLLNHRYVFFGSLLCRNRKRVRFRGHTSRVQPRCYLRSREAEDTRQTVSKADSELENKADSRLSLLNPSAVQRLTREDSNSAVTLS